MVGDCVPSGALLLARTQDASATVPLRFRFVMLGQKPGASQMRGASILPQRRRPTTDSEVDKGHDEVKTTPGRLSTAGFQKRIQDELDYSKALD